MLLKKTILTIYLIENIYLIYKLMREKIIYFVYNKNTN